MDVELTAWAHNADDPNVYVDPLHLGASDGDLAELITQDKDQRRNLYFQINSKALNGAVSVSSPVLQKLGISLRQTVKIRALNSHADKRRIMLDVVEIRFKGVMLTRNDQYKIAKRLSDCCVYSGQRLNYLNDLIRLHVDTLFRDGKKKFSGFIGDDTRLVFRSDSARVLIFIQMSSEMWNFDESGDIMFHRLVNSFIPEMLHRWHDQGDSHLVSIILFTSVTSIQQKLQAGKFAPETENFYRVVVDSVHISRWFDIMETLRVEFKKFPEEVLVTPEGKIRGYFSPSIKGNLLEAISLATTLLTSKFTDKDLLRSGVQALFATAGPTCYDVNLAEMYRLSRRLLGVEIGIELVCLARPPLHVAPLFRSLVSRTKPRLMHFVPTWINVSFWTPNKYSKQWIPQCRIYDLQMVGLIENHGRTLDLQFDVKQTFEQEYMKAYDARVFAKHEVQDLRPVVDGLLPVATTATTYVIATHEPSSPTLTTHSSGSDSVLPSPTYSTSNFNASMFNPINTLGPTRNLGRLNTPSIGSDMNMLAVNHTHAFKVDRKQREPATAVEYSFPSMWRVLSNAATVDNPSRVSAYGRWANVYPPKKKLSAVSWHSLKAPASLPLTSESFPNMRIFKENYKFQFYDVAIDPEEMDMPEVLDEMIGQRLMMGFQIAVGPGAKAAESSLSRGNPNFVLPVAPRKARDCVGVRIYLIRTGIGHRLSADDDRTINVRIYTYQGIDIDEMESPSTTTAVTRVKTKYDTDYHIINSQFLNQQIEHINWSMLDQQMAGADDPLENMSSTRNNGLVALRYVVIPVECQARNDLTPEEIHVEGVTKLVRALQKRCGNNSFIVHYYTGKMHDAVNEMLLDSRNQLVVNRLNTHISLKSMASEMQGKLGLPLRDRRWHFSLYKRVFTGNEFARWLLKTFSDINDLVEASDFAQKLMDQGLFRHPENRHKFINGHYFYQMTEEYAQEEIEDNQIQGVPNKVHVSESFIINVANDSTNKAERVKVSVDRLHNPKNTFHVLAEWLNATPKLVDEMFNSFSRLIRPYGLRLVQVAVADVQGSIEDSPFKTVVNVSLCTGGSTDGNTRGFLHFILRKYNYVLDIHGRSEISNYDVVFMWGRLQSTFAQYIHVSGYVLVQLTDTDTIIITPNTLHVSRAVMMGQAAESECDNLINGLRKLFNDKERIDELQAEYIAKNNKSK